MKTNLDTVTGLQTSRRKAAALTLGGLAAAGTVLGSGTSAQAAASDIRAVSEAQRAADQQTLLNLINAYRAQNGLAPVRHSATVAGVMKGEAERQFRAGYFSHGTEFIYNSKVQGYSFVREVIALSYRDSLQDLLDFWKSSPPHRAAILAPQANVIGIGFCYGQGRSLPWRVLANVGIYHYEAGKGPNDYVSTITGVSTQSSEIKEVHSYSLSGAIGEHYQNLGGASYFGQPTGDMFSSISGGYVQNFEKDRSIYWSPGSGAHNVYWKGAIGERYAAQNFEHGSWGYPLNEEHSFQGGARQDFGKNGGRTSVYWSGSTGAKVLNGRGAIHATWYALGGPSALGFPLTDEARWLDGVVRVTFTSGRTINWTENRGTWLS